MTSRCQKLTPSQRKVVSSIKSRLLHWRLYHLLRMCMEASSTRTLVTIPSRLSGCFSRQVASRFPKQSWPIRHKTHPNTEHSRTKILRASVECTGDGTTLKAIYSKYEE